MHPSPILHAALALAFIASAGAALAQAAAKDTAKGPAPATGPVATVNGIVIPRARADAVLRRQTSRGQADNEQLRAAIREELINREVIAQEATRAGVAKRGEVQNQMELARQEVLVNAFIEEYVRQNPIGDADLQKEYEQAKQQVGEREYRARHILVETEDEAKKLIGELQIGRAHV